MAAAYCQRLQRKTPTHWALHLDLLLNLLGKTYLNKGLHTPNEDIFAIGTSKPAFKTKASNLGTYFYCQGTDHLYTDFPNRRRIILK